MPGCLPSFLSTPRPILRIRQPRARDAHACDAQTYTHARAARHRAPALRSPMRLLRPFGPTHAHRRTGAGETSAQILQGKSAGTASGRRRAADGGGTGGLPTDRRTEGCGDAAAAVALLVSFRRSLIFFFSLSLSPPFPSPARCLSLPLPSPPF
jgi:hypothetical protein